MIVIEGMDNSGKSTLGLYLSRALGRPIQESEGPPKYPGEIADRIRHYNNKLSRDTIFVRHPVVSQLIYGQIRASRDEFPEELIHQFYGSKPLLIYCDPVGRGLSGHVEKSHDNQLHMDGVKSQYNDLLSLYREWAINRANLIYRIGDDMGSVALFCKVKS